MFLNDCIQTYIHSAFHAVRYVKQGLVDETVLILPIRSALILPINA
jgi:hypothetical protein